MPIEIWFLDEARIGQKNGLVKAMGENRHTAAPASQRYESAYLFGAICPARGVGAALALPRAITQSMQAHLEEISGTVAQGAHAVLLLDRAGWHTTPDLHVPENLTLIFHRTGKRRARRTRPGAGEGDPVDPAPRSS